MKAALSLALVQQRRHQRARRTRLVESPLTAQTAATHGAALLALAEGAPDHERRDLTTQAVALLRRAADLAEGVRP